MFAPSTAAPYVTVALLGSRHGGDALRTSCEDCGLDDNGVFSVLPFGDSALAITVTRIARTGTLWAAA